jgi:hypothetical protein
LEEFNKLVFMKRLLQTLALAGLILSTSACQYLDHVFAPPHPETAGWVKFTAPGWYRTLYVQAEACSGLSRNYESLQFYYHVQKDTADHVLDSEGRPVYAMSDAWARKIWIGSESLEDPIVIEHEMMHYLLDGVNGHPPKYFEQECHLRPWVYTSSDWSRDHNIMSAFYQQNGSLDLPILPNEAAGVSGGAAADETDEGMPAGVVSAQ